MSSRRNFEIDDVVRRVMGVFWRRGFERASMTDLTDAAGINRQSLYNALGDKQQVFVRALLAYIADVMRPWLGALEARGEPVEAIRTVFADIIDESVPGEAPVGCFVVNTAAELDHQTDEVRMLVRSALDDVRRFFERMIEHGAIRGEISADVDAEATAAALLGIVIAMRVMARGAGDRDTLQHMADRAMSLVSPAP